MILKCHEINIEEKFSVLQCYQTWYYYKYCDYHKIHCSEICTSIKRSSYLHNFSGYSIVKWYCDNIDYRDNYSHDMYTATWNFCYNHPYSRQWVNSTLSTQIPAKHSVLNWLILSSENHMLNKLIFEYLKTRHCKYYTLNIVYIKQHVTLSHLRSKGNAIP